MGCDPSETHKLLARARAGDQSAYTDLFNRHRTSLRRAIALRMDRRISGRIDASDILQETYLEAWRRLPQYLQKQEMPFHLWLFWLAREKVLALHRRHIKAEKRTLIYEVPLMPVDSSAAFVKTLVGTESSPSRVLARAELAEQLRVALGELDDDERDLILWRHFERLSARETAQLLQISEAAASKRYIRALERLRRRLLEAGIVGSAYL